MKRFSIITASIIMAVSAFAQSDCDISLGVYAGDEAMTAHESSMSYLKNVINKAISGSGNISSIEDSQFGIVVKTDIIDQHILAGAPTKTILNMSLTLYVADIADGKMFSSYSIDLNGVGNSEGKAFNNAIRKLNPANAQLKSFVAKAKEDVIGYYNRNYKHIIKAAETEASMKNYESALYKLMCIPPCSNGYDEAMKAALVVYQKYVDQTCHENLARARTVWMSGFNQQNAARAATFLSEIYPDAACYNEAQQLVSEIKQHMGEEWKFELRKWNDLVSIEKERLGNIREIVLAFAQNQPQTVIRLPY